MAKPWTRGAARSRREARAGWTLLEVVISTVILLTVAVGFSYGLASSTSLGHAVRDQGIAREAARAQLEELRGIAAQPATEFQDPFQELLRRYDANPGNDPPGASPGPHFDVPGLTAQPDDPDGRVGEIVFPLDEDGLLIESLDLPRLGMPRDLTGDGGADDVDHTLDYRLLPVLVRISWRGAAGDARFELVSFLKRMRP